MRLASNIISLGHTHTQPIDVGLKRLHLPLAFCQREPLGRRPHVPMCKQRIRRGIHGCYWFALAHGSTEHNLSVNVAGIDQRTDNLV